MSLLCWTKQLPWLEHLWEKCSGTDELHLQKPHYCCCKGLLPPEEAQIQNTSPVPALCQAGLVHPGPSYRGLGLCWGTGGCILQCGASWMSWQKGLLPFPTQTRSILSCPVPHCSSQQLLLVGCLGRRGAAGVVGDGGSCRTLCLSCWFCNNHGPSAQGSAWISGTELFKWGKKRKELEPSHKGRCFLRVVQLWAPAFCWSSHSSDDKCELITYSDSFCCRISLSVSGQTRGQNWGDTLLASAPLVGKYQTSFLLLC